MAIKLIETQDFYYNRSGEDNAVTGQRMFEDMAGGEGGGVIDGKTPPTTPTTYVVREQTFRIDINGLRPSTPHYMYYERVLVDSSKLKPVGGSLGDSLTTNANGVLSFDFFFTAEVPQGTSSTEINQYLASTMAGTKEVVVTNINQANLPSDYATVSSSYFAGVIGVSVYYDDATLMAMSGGGVGTGAGSGGPGDE